MITACNITKKFNDKEVITAYSLTIATGAFVVIKGASGSGKTTLFNLLSLIEQPDAGYVAIEGKQVTTAAQKRRLQQRSFAYLFQNYGLLANKTVAQNLAIGLAFQPKTAHKQLVTEALAAVHLPERIRKQKVHTLSGGEQQRVALARVLVKQSTIIFADEPTGNLDAANAQIVLQVLKRLNEAGKTIVLVTHDERMCQFATQTIDLTHSPLSPIA